MNPLQADPRKRKISALGRAQISLALGVVISIILSVTLHGSNLALLFRIVAGLDFIGIIVLEVQKQGLKKAMAAEEAEFRRQNPGSTPGVWPPP